MFVYSVLLVLHVIISICLMAVVLVQSGKGGGLSGAFGGAGATQAMFGGRGAGDFLTRTTQVLGAGFMLSSLVLVLLGGSGNRIGLSSESQRIIQEIQDAAAQTAAPIDVGVLPPLDEGFAPPAGGATPPTPDAGSPEAPAGGEASPPPGGDAEGSTGDAPGASGGELSPDDGS